MYKIFQRDFTSGTLEKRLKFYSAKEKNYRVK